MKSAISAALLKFAAYLFATAPGAIKGHINTTELKRSLLSTVGATSLAGLASALCLGLAANASAIVPGAAAAAVFALVFSVVGNAILRVNQGAPPERVASLYAKSFATLDEIREAERIPLPRLDRYGMPIADAASCPGCPAPPSCRRVPGLPCSLDDLESMAAILGAIRPPEGRYYRDMPPPCFKDPADMYRWFMRSFAPAVPADAPAPAIDPAAPHTPPAPAL